MLDELAEAESELTGVKTNRIKLIEQYGKELVEEAAIRNAVMEYVETQIKVKNEESPVVFQQDSKESASSSKESSKATESETKSTKEKASSDKKEESIETTEESSEMATIESKKAK